MIKKHEIQSIITIAIPLMAAFLAQRGVQFIDTIMMGWIGPTALAAGALGTAFFATISLFCMGVLSTVGVFIVRSKGSNDIDGIKSTLQHGFSLALLLSIPCMIIIWHVPHILFQIGENPLVVRDTTLLLHGMVWGFPGLLLFLVLREFTAAFSLTVIVMLVALLSIPLTFSINYILIYGKYHFPKLGIAGIGYGSAIGMWFMFGCLWIYSKVHPKLKEYVTFRSLTFSRIKFRDMLHIGLPSGTLFLLDAGMFLSTAILMGYFGVAALAAHQIAMQCVNIAYTLPVSLSMATALLVGHAAGAGNIIKVKRIAFISLGIALLASLLIAVIFIYSSSFLANIFLKYNTNHVNEVHQFAATFLGIAGIFLCFDAMQAVINGALRGLRDTFIPMLLSLGCYWVLGIGGAYYFSMFTPLGAKGVWYGLTLGLSSAAILLIYRFVSIIHDQDN
jgi:MATE family multidrug resistance protein